MAFQTECKSRLPGSVPTTFKNGKRPRIVHFRSHLEFGRSKWYLRGLTNALSSTAPGIVLNEVLGLASEKCSKNVG